MATTSAPKARPGLGFVAAAFVIVGALALPNWGCPPVETPPNDVSGTIAVHGYTVDPNDIMVRARPVENPDVPAGGKATPIVGHATRVPGGQPSQFEFKLTGLVENVPYRIGIKIANQDTKLYPRLVWSSNHDPLAIAGDSSLIFDAYAVRSEIAVMGTDQGRERADWVGADALDFADPTQAMRTFRWRTSLTNVTGGRLQVSLTPFPRVAERGYDPCANGDEGIVYTADFDADAVVGEWVTLPAVDFNALLLGGRDDASRGAKLLPGAVGAAVDDPNWATRTLPKLEAGHPLYVRVMPKVGETIVCDPDDGGVPPEVLLAHLVLEAIESLPADDPKIAIGTVWYTKPDIGTHPNPGETCYRITKDHKVLFPLNGGTVWDVLAVNNTSGLVYGNTVHRGMGFCVPPDTDDDGWLESFFEGLGAVFTGAIDALSDIVNYASKLWEEIQDAVVDVAAGAIDDLGIINCGDGSDCRAALETGLEIGLATMGVPPSIPNFDELVDQGIDYVAAQVASQVGVPEELVDYASQEAKDFVTKVANDLKTSNAVPGLPDWLVPDVRFEPAYVVMELYGPGKSQPFNSAPTLIRNSSPIYVGATVKLPIQLPKQGEDPPILFPMVLQPNTVGLTPAPPTVIQTLMGPVTIYPNDYEKAVWNKNQWITHRYAFPFSCYGFYLTALSNPGGIYNLRNDHFVPYDATISCE